MDEPPIIDEPDAELTPAEAPAPPEYVYEPRGQDKEEWKKGSGCGNRIPLYGCIIGAGLLIAALMARSGLLDARVPDKPLLLKRAMSAHRKAQSNTGSGVDVAASVYGGVFQYQLNGDAGRPGIATRPFHLPPDLLTVAVWTGRSASTPELVGIVNRLRDTKPEKYGRIMAKMKKLSQSGIGAIRNSDTRLFLNVVLKYYEAMAELGNASNAPIISDPHRDIAAICQGVGVQYKPSGAGGGDLGILFSQKPDRMRDAVRELESSGYPAFDLQIGTHGIQIQAMKKER